MHLLGSLSCGRTGPLCQQMKAERGSWAGTHHLLSCHCGLLFKEEINNCNKHQWARARCSVGPSAASAKPFCVCWANTSRYETDPPTEVAQLLKKDQWIPPHDMSTHRTAQTSPRASAFLVQTNLASVSELQHLGHKRGKIHFYLTFI